VDKDFTPIKNLFIEILQETVDKIFEYQRELIERDYHQYKVHTYDYYFTLKNDPNILYSLQTNIRMNKYYTNRFYWYINETNNHILNINFFN